MESLPYLNAIALNTFLEVAVRENLNILNLKFPEALETLSIIGEKEYSLETLTSIADKVRSDTEMSLAPNSASIPGLLLYGSLKHITCGTEPSELKAVLEVPNVARYLLPILGTVKSCPNPLALELMANSVRFLAWPLLMVYVTVIRYVKGSLSVPTVIDNIR